MLVADPYTTPPDDLLNGFHERYPGSAVVGGMASGSTGPGAACLLSREGVHDEGALVVAISGSVRMDTVVSQGCRPVGSHLVITKADRNAILSLGGKPALEALKAVADDVSPEDQALMRNSLHVGRVVDERKSHFERGDFLVRNVLGIDPQTNALLIGDMVRAGQTIQFMVRDAQAAGEELSALLDREASASDTRGKPMGSMVFSCNGRGSRFFGRPHHDIGHVHDSLGDVPTAGFFAAGEIGPVGGQPFLHGFTASIAVFREQPS
jgi:small ligand-binding sensory domain FIST